MSESPSIVYGPDGRLAGDVRCVACGHNLRGLTPNGVCVECGSPVGWSLRGAGFLSANVEWLAAVRSGVAELAMLLPWAWFPLVWPWIGWALWKLTRPNPSASADEGAIHSVMGRTILALLPPLGLPATVFAVRSAAGQAIVPFGASPAQFTIVLTTMTMLGGWMAIAFVASIALRRFAIGTGSRSMRGMLTAAAALTLVVCILLALGVLQFLGAFGLRGIGESTAYVLVDAAFVLGPGLIAALCVVIGMAWRALDASEAQARALRERPPCWQRPVPG